METERATDRPLQVYSWPTPNGQKVHIMVEELGIPYEVHPIDIGKGDQFHEGFLKISPNNKIPAIVDPDGPGNEPLSLFESGAILLYLAEKHGKLLPNDPVKRWKAMEWLFFQVGNYGPLLGQAHHFRKYAPQEDKSRVEYGIERYSREANRLYGVLDKHLAEHEYLAGDEYSIADIANYPWSLCFEMEGVDITQYPNIQRWQKVIGERLAVRRGMKTLKDSKRELSEDDKEVLFGQK